MEATFKARARTLDMLGRQQIAGIPTAMRRASFGKLLALAHLLHYSAHTIPRHNPSGIGPIAST